jgi:nitrate/nitrite transport system ATP-binding protein
MTPDQVKAMFQNHSLLPWPTVFDNVQLEVASSPTYLKCRQRVLEVLYERHRFIEAA